MPLSTSIVGTRSAPVDCLLDNRWAMNFAAGIDDRSDVLYDTRNGPIPVHPIFLAHPEWESQKQLMELLGLSIEERGRGVQVTHDSQLYRPLKSGMTLSTEAIVVGVERHRAGAWSTVQYDTKADGELVARTTVAVIYRGVEVVGEDRPAHLVAASVQAGGNGMQTIGTLDLPSTACHLYSECARIWNPIHTDLDIATAAGLPGLILHGTATLARAVSAITNRLTDGDPTRISRISGRFQAMAIVPGSLQLTFQVYPVNGLDAQQVTFTALTASGEKAIGGGVLELRSNASLA